LQTNLLKGGRGHDIFDTPLIDLIGEHVDPGWATTHFLSFSEEKQTARRFGLRCSPEEVDRKMEHYDDYYGDGADWDFAVIEIDPYKVNLMTVAEGLYKGTHEPTLTKFKQYPGFCSMLLIDVVKTALQYPQLSNQHQVLEYAREDKEWLLLPTSPVLLNGGKVEYSGIFDGFIISDITKYKRWR